jgi:hypothetical protein
MAFNNRFITVGVTDRDPHKDMGVVLYIAELGHVIMSEDAARKLADDILRNANYLWPLEEEHA